ncbi:hypothetical protein VTK26DRAFT_6578 [Humicola hyalothermophila]
MAHLHRSIENRQCRRCSSYRVCRHSYARCNQVAKNSRLRGNDGRWVGRRHGNRRLCLRNRIVKSYRYQDFVRETAEYDKNFNATDAVSTTNADGIADLYQLLMDLSLADRASLPCDGPDEAMILETEPTGDRPPSGTAERDDRRESPADGLVRAPRAPYEPAPVLRKLLRAMLASHHILSAKLTQAQPEQRRLALIKPFPTLRQLLQRIFMSLQAQVPEEQVVNLLDLVIGQILG